MALGGKSEVVRDAGGNRVRAARLTVYVADTMTPAQLYTVTSTDSVRVPLPGVNTILTEGKMKVFKGRLGQRSDVKKAIVTLEEGQKIDVTTGL